MFDISKMILAGTLFVGVSSCVEIQKKDAKENTVEAAHASVMNFSGDEVFTEERLAKISARKLTNRDSSVWLVEADQIIFSKDTRLITNGLNVLFRATTVNFGDRTNLATFPMGIKANPDTPGRSGGYITIAASRVEGWLYVDFRGENGGVGSPGLPPDESLTGEPGARGFNGTCQMTVANLLQPAHMVCGNAGYGRRGADGKPGFKGGTGLPGGDAGRIEIIADDVRNFNYRIESNHPGAGGPGGQGGAGGKGGPYGSNGGATEITYEMGVILSHYYTYGKSPDLSVLSEKGEWVFVLAGEKDQPSNPGPIGPDGDVGLSGQLGIIEINGSKPTLNP